MAFRRFIYALPDKLPVLLEMPVFPEQTIVESEIIHDFLAAHGAEYDEVEFSMRVGAGQTPDPAHLEEIQALQAQVTRAKIDLRLVRAGRTTIAEVKERLTFGVVGQLRAYQRLYLEDFPGTTAPALLAIGRFASDTPVRVLQQEGITVLLYAR